MSDTKTVEVTIDCETAERLHKEFGTSLSLAEAMRQAADEALRARERELTPEDVRKAIVEALESAENRH